MKYEYKQLDTDWCSIASLAALEARDGWDLLTVAHVSHRTVVCVFRREKEGE